MNTPVSSEIPLHQVAELGRNLDLWLDDLRSANPIVWSDINRAWIVTGNAEVAEGYSGRLPLSAYRFPHVTLDHISQDDQRKRLSTLMNAVQDWINNNDGPKHLRLRKLVANAFGKKVVDEIRPYTRRIIQETLDAVAHKEEVEVVSDIAVPVPGRVTLKLLGLPEKLLPDLKRWSQIITKIANINTPLEELMEVDALLLHFREMLTPEFEKRRRLPSNDFLSALVTTNDAGDQLSDEEMFAICDVTMIGGYDSISNTLAFSVAALARDPDAVDYIRNNPGDSANIVMELSRCTGMSTVFSRMVTEDFNWKGNEIRKGEAVFLFQSAANRDPLLFPEPDLINFHRSQNRNVAFGGGPHFCIGRLLAVMQIGELLPELFGRFDVELVSDELDFGHILGFRSLKKLPVRLHARVRK